MEEIGQGRLAAMHVMAVREAGLQNRKWNQQHTLIRKKHPGIMSMTIIIQ
jgi:hypothetical protein